MRLDVPFFPQTNDMNCGPAALQMILAYFGSNQSLEIIEKAAGIEPEKGLYTIQLAQAAAKLGYQTYFASTCVGVNPENLHMEFYKKNAPTIENRIGEIIRDSVEAGVKIEERTLDLDEVLSKLTPDSLEIVLLDWNIVRGTPDKGYQGHFVPIVGYDDQFVYVHNQSNHKPEPFMAIEKKTFDQARKAKGTDEDIMIILRPSKANNVF